jgi:hypothetical protein
MLRSMALNILRNDFNTTTGILVSSNWFTPIKNLGNCKLRLLKVIAGPVPTLIWKWRLPLGKMSQIQKRSSFNIHMCNLT